MLKDSMVVVVPEWLQNTLSALGKPLSILFDFTELSKVLTQQDLAFYVFLNRTVFQASSTWLTPFLDTLDFPDYIKCESSRTIRSIGSEYLSTFEKINDLVRTVPALYGKETDGPPHYIGTGTTSTWPIWILAGLLNGPVKSDLLETYRTSQVFELIPIGDKRFGLKLLPADPQNTAQYQFFRSIDNSIGHLHQYYGFDDIAGTKLFRVFADYASSSNI